LVDSNLNFLKAAMRFLAKDPEIEIVGSGDSGRSALNQVRLLGPDLVLMDLAMTEMNGLEATRRIKAQPGAPRVIILTLHDHPQYRTLAEAAGADGFLNKANLGSHLLPLIYTLFARGTER
jgi:DNA-binding NarL/FixJ family response regulator